MSGQVSIEQDCGGWLVRRDPRIAAWAERDGLWPGKTVAQHAYERVRACPDRVMLVDDLTPRTCAELFANAGRVAAHLRARGVGRGDVVSFQLPNWWEASVINLAAAMIGAVVNPILPINREAELSFILRDAGTKVLFLPSSFRGYDYAAMIDRVVRQEALETEAVFVRGDGRGGLSFAEICERSAAIDAPFDVEANAVKLIMYTSGTTGRPKGVLHSHNTINADSLKMQVAIGLGREDRTFIPSPVTHVTGYLWVLNVPWACDVPAVTIDVWDPGVAFDRLQAHGCAFMAGATPFLRDLIQVAEARTATLASLRNYLCGGASVPPDLIFTAARVFPNCIAWRNYGSTEAPTLTRGPQSRDDLRLGAETDGKIYHSEVVIRDVETGEPLPPGRPGEIFAREPSMALGYVHAEDNDAAYDEDGFFRMGDVGKIVDGDHIVVTDRLKDIIIRSGENLSSKEIEDALLTSPDIADAAVVGVPNEKTGEAVFAFLVTRPGVDMSVARLIEIIVQAGLAKQKTPELFRVIDELPRTASGKVIKHQLRAQARELVRQPA